MAKIHHSIFSTPKEKLLRLFNKDPSDVIKEYVNSDKFTPEEYVNLLTNKYIHPEGENSQYKISEYGSLSELPHHQHATPENNQKILEDYLQKYRDWHENEFNPNDPVYHDTPVNDLHDLYQHLELPSNTVHDILDKPEDYGFFPDQKKNEYWRPNLKKINGRSLKKEHLHKIVDKYPEIIDNYISHPEVDDDFINRHIMGNDNILGKLDTDSISVLSRKQDLSPGHAQKLLNTGKYYKNTFSTLLDKLPENERNTYLNNVLGIDGGRNFDELDEEALRDEDGLTDQQVEEKRQQWNDDTNWENWGHGNEHSTKAEEYASLYPNLSNEHAEHIMRHGSNESRWNLYHNENIDPKFAIQMYDKWSNDDHHHGYDKDNFLEKLREEYADSVRDGIYEEARENVEQNYPLSEYLRDNGEQYVDDSLLQDHSDDIHDLVSENYPNEDDWMGDNPDYDPDKWNALQQLKSFYPPEGEKGQLGLFGTGSQELNHQMIVNAGVDPEVLDDWDFDPNNPSDTLPMGQLEEEYKQYAPKIDYSNHDEYSITDHPEYDDRYNEAADDYKSKIVEKWNDGSLDVPEHIYEDYDEHNSYDRDREESDLIDQHFESAMENEDYIPQHVLDNHPDISRIRNERRRAEEEAARQRVLQEEDRVSGFLNRYIPERSKEHEYGEGLHHHEMLQDYAKQNNGKIDMGRMVKMHPNLKDTWKKIFNGKGKLSSEEIDQKIDQLPKNKYAISYRDWSGMQRTNRNTQVVFRLDHTDDSVAPLKENQDVYNTFKHVQEVSQRSGHPTNANTIAWSRVDTTDPKHWFIDEVQSDFSSSARNYLKREGATEKANHIQAIIDHHKDWRENITNHIIKEAKRHGVEKISTHSPESKAAHTDAGKVHTVYKDSYKKVPRSMGFLPAPSQDFPLDDSGKRVFTKERSTESAADRIKQHEAAFHHHINQGTVHSDAINNYHRFEEDAIKGPQGEQYFHPPEEFNEKLSNKHSELSSHHFGMARKHQQAVKQLDPTHDLKNLPIKPRDEKDPYANDTLSPTYYANAGMAVGVDSKPSHRYDSLLDKPVKKDVAHEGHTLDLRPKGLQKSLELVDLLIKTEYLYALGLEKGLDITNLKKNIQVMQKSLYGEVLVVPYIQEPHNKNKWLKQADLMKGSFQKKNRFNPESVVDKDSRESLSNWQESGDDYDRYNSSRLEGSGRKRALRKLASLTHVKTLNGEPHYLLHRGMSDNEHHNNIESHGNAKTNYHKEDDGQVNSWTPNYSTADSFRVDYGMDGTTSHIVSAWIPEKAIYNYLPQLGDITNDGKGPNEFQDEKEVFVQHNDGHHLAHPDYIREHIIKQKPDVHGRINSKYRQISTDKSQLKGKALDTSKESLPKKFSDPKNIRQASKLAASEKANSDLVKHDFSFSKNKSSPFHGWISPKGEYHKMAPDDGHMEFINRKGLDSLEAMNKGWISVGHGGGHNAGVHRDMINRKSHPAMRTLRELLTQSTENDFHIDVHGHRMPQKDEPQFFTEYGYRVDPHEFSRKGLTRDSINQTFRPRQNVVKNEKLTLNQSKWIKRAKIVKNEDLNKGLKQGLATGAAVLGMMYGANEISKPHQDSRDVASMVNPNERKEQVVKEAPDFHLKTDMMYALKQNPIPNNRYLNKKLRHGNYSLHQDTVKNVVRQDQNMRKQYGHILNLEGDSLDKELVSNPYMDRQIATKHFDNLQGKFGNKPDRIAHAWYHGPEATQKEIKEKQDNADFSSHQYVSKVLNSLDK